RLEHVLELLDAGAQGRLGHAAGLGSAAEMAMVGERHQVAQMPYGGQMLHAIAPNRGGGCRVGGTSPEVHAAECGGGHKLSVMAVKKMRFLLDRDSRCQDRLPHASLGYKPPAPEVLTTSKNQNGRALTQRRAGERCSDWRNAGCRRGWRRG